MHILSTWHRLSYSFLLTVLWGRCCYTCQFRGKVRWSGTESLSKIPKVSQLVTAELGMASRSGNRVDLLISMLHYLKDDFHMFSRIWFHKLYTFPRIILYAFFWRGKIYMYPWYSRGRLWSKLSKLSGCQALALNRGWDHVHQTPPPAGQQGHSRTQTRSTEGRSQSQWKGM